MQESKCFCLQSIWAVFNDLGIAVERLERSISDEHVKLWIAGYREGLVAAQNRFRITQGKCCCERTDNK
jgi:hypothetical protein